MKRTLITGAGGFCGRHLIRHIARTASAYVLGADLHAAPPPGLPLDEYLPADLTIADQAETLVKRAQPDVVFHLAALMHGEAADLYRTNLLGGIHLLEAVRQFAPEASVLVIGSAAEYGVAPAEDMPLAEDYRCRPQGAYGMSKYALTLAALDYAHNRRMKVAVVRPFNIVGPGVPASLVVGAMLRRIKEALDGGGEPVVRIGNLETERDFIAVQDAVDAYLRLVECDAWGEVFNVCSGRPRSIRSVVEQLLSFSDRPLRLVVDPGLVRPTDVPVVYGSWRKAHRTFGFEPATPLDDALRAAWEHVMGGDR